jgi:hypothetical protein
MGNANSTRLAAAAVLALAGASWAGTTVAGGGDAFPLFRATGLSGRFIPLSSFRNPQPNIPAQCYIETSGGTQNACQYCHTDGLADAALGNAGPQGALQLTYAFAPGLSRNHWENTLFPGRLRQAVAATGEDPAAWDMADYIRQDDWAAAYARRGGDPRVWNSAPDGPFRLMPGLDPADLPADTDGFVRSRDPSRGDFDDGSGWNTGWRAVNFMPYGVFTPMTGSVSGIYIRLPRRFMQDAGGRFDLDTYRQNLDLLVRAIQDRLDPADPDHYLGAAADVRVQRGLYPLGTEFAHPLHYVDVAADGSDPTVSPFPGTRARRVKEVRYMYKWYPFDPTKALAASGGEEEEEGGDLGNVLANPQQGWIENGAGWILAAFIEDRHGALRPQGTEELMQCLGCHSGPGGYGGFKSGTGNTVDSTWALPRKLAGDQGWREMDYLGYRHDPGAGPGDTPGVASLGDPVNRSTGEGELGYFLDRVVGASLFGDMPAPIEAFMARTVRRDAGYSANWPALDTGDPGRLLRIQRLRQALMRELTARGDYLGADGSVQGALLYPPESDALAGARRYRQVVATQRYTLGKDVFPQTPFTLRYFRPWDLAYAHRDGRPYRQGEVITDRPVDAEGNGRVATLIGLAGSDSFQPGYQPYLADPTGMGGF